MPNAHTLQKKPGARVGVIIAWYECTHAMLCTVLCDSLRCNVLAGVMQQDPDVAPLSHCPPTLAPHVCRPAK